MVLFSCANQKLVDFKVDSETGFPVISITYSNAVKPVIFLANNAQNEGSIFFETGDEKIWINGQPVVKMNSENSFIAEWKTEGRSIKVNISGDKTKYYFNFSAYPDTDIVKWGFNLAATPDEYFTGLFEHVVDGDQKKSWEKGIKTALNLRGQTVEMLIKPTLSLYTPFYLSSNGYGLFIEGTWPGYYDFCKTNPEIVNVQFEGPSLEGILYTSKKPAEIVKSHALHVGPAFVPPKWAFRPYRWRDTHTNKPVYYDGTATNAPFNSMLVEDILMMEALDIPCRVYWIDRPWAKGPMGYDDFEWDSERFPNAQEMIHWLNSKNIDLLLWIAPWVDGEMSSFARQEGYDVPFAVNRWTNWAQENALSLIDFTNPEAKKWWQQGIAKMLKQGIKGFKLDRSEEIVPETHDIIFANGKTAREMRNAYPVEYVRATNEICSTIYPDDFVIFPRAGYSGSSRYGVFWGGDIGSPAEGLRCAIIAAQRSSLIGFPLWGSDIGGYWHGDMDREVTARWLAFGCFTPIFEFGPTEDRAPWDMRSEPNYDAQLIAIWRLYAKLHDQLSDYSYANAVKAKETGMPLIRPLFLEYADQPAAWQDWQTFTYGPDILVSAIWQKNIHEHTFYLPAGSKWVDAWDKNRIYEGGQNITVETPLYKIPIFIKEGSTIDLGDLNALYRESLQIAGNKPDLSSLEKMQNWK
ncbi:MAG: glycoside hydrolase family 31 protein [Calditrichaeota bacterium]|nr:glycoside hydrolase family 31 protein [Calditrichota bacterium]